MTSKAIPSGDNIKPEFNSDIGYAPGSEDAIRTRFADSPGLVELLVDTSLIKAFQETENAALGKKVRLHRWGLVSLIAAGTGLAAAAVEITLRAFAVKGLFVESLSVTGSLLALFALICAWLAVSVWKLRKKWLENRFAAERLRQWHFQMLLDAELTKMAATDVEKFKEERRRRFEVLRNGELKQLAGTVGQWMNTPGRPEGLLHGVSSMAPSHPFKDEVWAAFRWLRLEHQARHWALKVNPEERLVLADERIRAVGQVCFALAVFLQVVQVVAVTIDFTLGAGQAWHSWIGPVGVAMTGLSLVLVSISIAFKAIDEGLGYRREVEHYRNMAIVYVGILARSEYADTPEQRLAVMRDVEIWAQSELRDFMLIHANAKFLL